MPAMARHTWLAGILLLGCGADDVPPDGVDFDRICGVDGPVPLLELAESEFVSILMRTSDRELLASVVQTTSPTGEWTWTITDTWLLDECGEAMQDASTALRPIDDWEGLPIACDPTSRDLVELDDRGSRARRVLARGGCSASTIAGVLVARDAAPGSTVGRLVRVRPGPDGAIVETLLPEIFVDPEWSGLIQVFEGRAFERTPDLALVSVDPSTGETAVEAEPVARVFGASSRHVIYRHPPDGEDESVPGPLFLRDRRSGAEVTLAEDVPASWYVKVDDAIAGAWSLAGDGQRRLFWTDGSELLPPTPGVDIIGVRPDGLVWLRRAYWSRTPVMTTYYRWPRGEAPRLVMECWRCEGHVRRGELEILDERRLSVVSAEGGMAFELAAPVDSNYARLYDDRVVTMLDEVDEHGTFVLHDHGIPKTIAANVRRNAVEHTARAGLELGEVFYEQRNPDGTHTLYRARLPPAAE